MRRVIKQNTIRWNVFGISSNTFEIQCPEMDSINVNTEYLHLRKHQIVILFDLVIERNKQYTRSDHKVPFKHEYDTLQSNAIAYGSSMVTFARILCAIVAGISETQLCCIRLLEV